MRKNTRIRVAKAAPFHAGRLGYFAFMGELDADTVVLSCQPDLGKGRLKWFAISLKHVEFIGESAESWGIGC